ncbi:MAG: hypothetical protein Q4F21_03500 [Lachnospiraceae bacterium]|nr:hypothetical protein [Lachnospiraceae bacterium]
MKKVVYLKKKPDLRVTKTLRSIQTAFYELCKQYELNKITVKALTEKAEINKTTFYLHYDSIQSLIYELEQEVIELIIGDDEQLLLLLKKPHDYISFTYKRMMSHPFGQIISQNSANVKMEFMIRHQNCLQEHLYQLKPELKLLPDFEALLSFITAGAIGFYLNKESRNNEFQNNDEDASFFLAHLIDVLWKESGMNPFV